MARPALGRTPKSATNLNFTPQTKAALAVLTQKAGLNSQSQYVSDLLIRELERLGIVLGEPEHAPYAPKSPELAAAQKKFADRTPTPSTDVAATARPRKPHKA
jgi:hypothetical protein